MSVPYSYCRTTGTGHLSFAGKNISEIEQRILDEMINKGVAEDQFIRQINRQVKGAVGQVTGKVVDILFEPLIPDGKAQPEIRGLRHVQRKAPEIGSGKPPAPKHSLCP